MWKRGVYLFVFVLVINLVSASGIEFERDSYYPGETLQAKIDFNFSLQRPLTQSNLELSKDSQLIKTAPFIKQISNNSYYLYFQIPTSLDAGTYDLIINDIYYIDGILKTTSIISNFSIITLDKGYKYLLNNQNADGSFGNIIETSLSSIALNNIGYTNSSNKAVAWLLSQQDINGCFPKGNCNVRDTSFALLALNKFNKDTIKTKNWLLDSSNNFNLGTWALDIKSNATGICILNGQEINITKTFSQKLIQPAISLDCNKLNQSVNLSISHSYLGTVYSNLVNLNGKTISYNINDNGCFGVSYKSDCDYLSTAYAAWILNQIDSYNDLEYLTTNISETSTLQHALLYLIANDQDALNWLLNNKQNEAWGKFSASISNGQNDVFTSSFVFLALKEKGNLTDTLNWLRNQPNANVLDTAIKLYATYSNEALTPIVSVNPGYIDSYDVSFTIENKNDLPIQIDLETPLGVTSDRSSFILINKDSFKIKIDKNKFNGGQLNLKYGSNSYDIPIFLEGMPVVEDEEEPILDSTYLELIGVASQIKETLSKNQSKQAMLKVRNNQRTPVSNIAIEVKGEISNIIIFPSRIARINPNEIIELNLSINNNRNAKVKIYTGSIIFKNQDFNLELPVTVDIKEAIEQIKQDKEVKVVEPNKKSKLYWIIPFAIIFLIGIIIFFKTKKPKTESFDTFLKSIEGK